MAQSTIDRLIINSPYEEPAHHWSYERETRLFELSKDATSWICSGFT
jgi:type III restriction enzyme